MNQPTIGERLRQAREAIPASLYEVSRDTKIRVDFLQSIERDSFSFAWSTYVKGMVRGYSRWLGLNEDEIITEFEQVHGEGGGPSVRQIFKEPAAAAPRRRSPRWMIAAALAASTLLVLSLVGVMNPPENAPPPLAPASANGGSAGGGQTGAQAPQSIAQAPAIQGVELAVEVAGKKCWMRVVADGDDKPVFEGNLFSGAVQTFTATQRLEVLFGDMGAVVIRLNGRDMGSPGPAGQVGKFVFTPETTAFVKAGTT